jgi:hypothetical protein
MFTGALTLNKFSVTAQYFFMVGNHKNEDSSQLVSGTTMK